MVVCRLSDCWARRVTRRLPSSGRYRMSNDLKGQPTHHSAQQSAQQLCSVELLSRLSCAFDQAVDLKVEDSNPFGMT